MQKKYWKNKNNGSSKVFPLLDKDIMLLRKVIASFPSMYVVRKIINVIIIHNISKYQRPFPCNNKNYAFLYYSTFLLLLIITTIPQGFTEL